MAKNETAAPAAESDAAAEPMRRVKMREDAPTAWTHAGKQRKPGEVVEVDSARALRLQKAGIVEILAE